jgi:hypothetical protein
MLGRGHPVAPGVGLLPEHQTGVGGEAGLGVAKVDPPPLPASVVGRHGTRDVVVLVVP